jgi:lysophospholipase L1-like esterase
MKTSRLLLLFLLVITAVRPISSAGAFGRLGAMGDSLSDEYWDSGVATYATNWTILLSTFRGVDMGPTAAQAGTNSWGTPRNQGYKYNWALSGANSSTLLSEGQHTGLAAQAGPESITTAVLEIGSNDFNPSSGSAYSGIYLGTWSAAQIQAYVNQSVSNIETALVTVRTAGVTVVIANLLDPGSTPAVGTFFVDGSKRDRVAAVVQTINTGLKNLGQKYQVPVMDWYGLEKAVLGPNTALKTTLKVGNVTMNLRGSDPGPPNATPTNAFVSDGFHPNTTFQGIFANVVIQALNSLGANLSFFSEQEILAHALITYGGSDTLLAQIGPYSSFVILPVLPRITSISVAGTNVALQFSSVSNQTYVLESRDDLVTGSWASVTSNIPGNGGTISITNQVAANLPMRFYRVRQLP